MLPADRQLRPAGRVAAIVVRLRDAPWMTASWIMARARVLLVLNLALVAGAIAVAYRPEPGSRPVSVDFVSFYAAGRLAAADRPALAYDLAAHGAAEDAITEPGGSYQFFFYPPPYLLLCQTLAALPYPLAFALFEAVTLALFLVVMRKIVGGGCLLPVLAFSPVFWTMAEGQNAFLTAALLGAATLLVDRRPILAAMLVGAVCYKPHLGLMVPVALLAGSRWRATAVAAATVACLLGLSWWCYGAASWAAFLHGFFASGQTFGFGRITFAGIVSVFGALRLVGLTPMVAVTLQTMAALIAAGVVAWVWRCSRSPGVRGAALLSGTMLAVPIVLLYDQLVTLVALAWLVREGRATGFLTWEKLLLAAAFVLATASFPLAIGLGLPLAPLPAALLLAACTRRTMRATGRPETMAPIVVNSRGDR